MSEPDADAELLSEMFDQTMSPEVPTPLPEVPTHPIAPMHTPVLFPKVPTEIIPEFDRQIAPMTPNQLRRLIYDITYESYVKMYNNMSCTKDAQIVANHKKVIRATQELNKKEPATTGGKYHRKKKQCLSRCRRKTKKTNKTNKTNKTKSRRRRKHIL